jgi:hypothetical protein
MIEFQDFDLLSIESMGINKYVLKKPGDFELPNY